MSGTPFVAPRFIPVSSTGRPYPAARLYFYRAGTTTLATVYTNSALTVPAANPLTANSAGMFDAVYLDPDGGDVKAVLQDSRDVQLWSEDNISVAPSLTQAAVGAALYPRSTEEIDAGVTPSDYSQPYGWVTRFGTDKTAFDSALLAYDSVYVPEGNYTLGSTLTLAAGKTIYGCGLASQITKGANGAMISMGKDSTLRNLYLYGSGSTYTGVGVTIPYTAEFEGRQVIDSCRIYDSASYCVQYVSGGAGAGFGSKIIDSDMRVTSDTVACVQWGNDPSNSHGNRSIINCTAGSGPLVDCYNADNGFIIGNTIGDNGSAAGILFGATSAKVIVIGNRIAATTTITLQGQAHTVVGNVVASAITLASGTADCHIGNNTVTGAITDSSGQANQIDAPLASYSGAWTGSGGNPAIGDGASYFYSVREGRQVTVYAGITMGSTTTYGTGSWRISLPVACSGSANAIGSALMYDNNATKYYVGLAKIEASGTYLQIAPDASTTGDVTSSNPFTWAQNDFVRVQITYPV